MHTWSEGIYRPYSEVALLLEDPPKDPFESLHAPGTLPVGAQGPLTYSSLRTPGGQSRA